LVPWLEKSINDSSNIFFKKPANFLGEGGSIPFMGMLGKMFPQASFCVTGVLGPQNNAHGPNEMLVIDMGKKVTACVAKMINDHYNEYKK
jgi:acetylornithine deacetylase/succinyl-diaminopimelate desuccinylase-like protein